MPIDNRSPRLAATVLVVRDGPRGLEVLMLRRAERPGDYSSGAHVFPGGTLDASDGEQQAWCDGLSDAQASARLGLVSGGLACYVAAVRECFEEAGVLLACDASSRPVDLDREPAALIAELRSGLREHRIGMREVCDRLGMRLALDQLAYHSHWLTPPGLAKRFDTRFFVGAMPPGQTAALESEETAHHCWIRPQEALDAGSRIRLPHPTRRTLESVAGFASAAELLASTRALSAIARTMPHMADGPKGPRPVDPGEAAYAEIARLDPNGEGHARYALEPGRAVRLSPHVVRITAPNPGVMTGPGTNTYLVGDPVSNRWAVIDPGPADAAHVQAVLAAAPGPIDAVLVTHTHVDHSPAAALMKTLTGAPVMGMAPLHDGGHDTTFAPERRLAHGDRVAAGDVVLDVVHTPGHASNHLCYLLRAEKTLFTGDHVMQGSTVVINPPDGDMRAYMASLHLLQQLDLDWLAPGHGFLIGEPRAAVAALVAHRLAREAKVVQVLADVGPATIDMLLARVYDDVAPALHVVARRSLMAHLLDLQTRRRVSRHEGLWSL
jgi:glyoxylase-like metal-dependent hydrolase (beta-lactamase superfamily II)/8-oxo-dGTP pyrophosphatase MutT (NUDIX family)